MEEKVKDLIRDSLYKRIEGFDQIDDVYDNEELVNNFWLSDIMALGLCHLDLESATQKLYQLEKPLLGNLLPFKTLEDYRARINLSFARFSNEAMAFEKYVRMHNTTSEEKVLKAVREELEDVEEGDFELF